MRDTILHCAHILGFIKRYPVNRIRHEALRFQTIVEWGLLGSEKIAKVLFQVISVDIMGPFPRSPKGFTYLLVVTDWFTKYKILSPMHDATACR